MDDIALNLIHKYMTLLSRSIYDIGRKYFTILPTSIELAIEQLIKKKIEIQGENVVLLMMTNV